MATSNFEAAPRHVLVHEGGFVDHPKDPGGETNYGVTKRTARAHDHIWTINIERFADIKNYHKKKLISSTRSKKLVVN